MIAKFIVAVLFILVVVALADIVSINGDELDSLHHEVAQSHSQLNDLNNEIARLNDELKGFNNGLAPGVTTGNFLCDAVRDLVYDELAKSWGDKSAAKTVTGVAMPYYLPTTAKEIFDQATWDRLGGWRCDVRVVGIVNPMTVH